MRVCSAGHAEVQLKYEGSRLELKGTLIDSIEHFGPIPLLLADIRGTACLGLSYEHELRAVTQQSPFYSEDHLRCYTRFLRMANDRGKHQSP